MTCSNVQVCWLEVDFFSLVDELLGRGRYGTTELLRGLHQGKSGLGQIDTEDEFLTSAFCTSVIHSFIHSSVLFQAARPTANIKSYYS